MERRSTFELEDKSVLRATHSSAPLRWFGHELRVSPDKIAVDRSLANRAYEKSFEVSDQIDVFLSHSWHAPPFSKYLMLLVYFNGVPAIVSGVLVAAFGNLYMTNLVSQHLATTPVLTASISSTLLVLVFWQHIVVKTCGSTISMFFDKLCIHQWDIDLKSKGISSICGIIASSRTLLVAWDASYFKRLWCPFEIAAFMASNPSSEIVVLPVEIGTMLLALSIAGLVKAISAQRIFLFYNHKDNDFYEGLMSMDIVLTIPCFILAYVHEQNAQHLLVMRRQVATYSIREAECFCCLHQHVHPESGCSLPCDREYVYSAIARWNGSGELDQVLDVFDQLIRRTCTSAFEQNFGSCGISYRYMLMVTICRGLTCMVTVSAMPERSSRAFGILVALDTFTLREPLCAAFMFRVIRCALMHENVPLNCTCVRVVLAAVLGLIMHSTLLTITIIVGCDHGECVITWQYLLWLAVKAAMVWCVYFRRAPVPLAQETDDDDECSMSSSASCESDMS
eukprot:TRINITY_DN75789_c0_g1_i1.p1 TRINITY_DN75789_c0_g1~~TRINITY_DN75789_c0_g1_i1.p1  ORF type:complete len:509 (-),score=33.97 TRINITY_DN75789_c0_g1_i1:24-1550(-)